MHRLSLFNMSHGAVMSLGLVYLCGCLGANQDEPNIEFATCENRLPGIDWGDSNIPEALADIDAELAATDISDLPDPIDISAMASCVRPRPCLTTIEKTDSWTLRSTTKTDY